MLRNVNGKWNRLEREILSPKDTEVETRTKEISHKIGFSNCSKEAKETEEKSDT